VGKIRGTTVRAEEVSMRKLALAASVALLIVVGCGDGTGGEDQTVATAPAEDTASPAGSPTINEKGTETFTTEEFDVELELDNFYFDPTYIKSPGESTATITLHNEGDVQHTFTVDDLDVDEELAPDEEKEITVQIGTETRYEYYCRFHEGQGMRGAFQPH
jgi:plastocyanin